MQHLCSLLSRWCDVLLVDVIDFIFDFVDGTLGRDILFLLSGGGDAKELLVLRQGLLGLALIVLGSILPILFISDLSMEVVLVVHHVLTVLGDVFLVRSHIDSQGLQAFDGLLPRSALVRIVDIKHLVAVEALLGLELKMLLLVEYSLDLALASLRNG